MLGNTQNKDSVKEENKKLNLWFWFLVVFAVIDAVIFVFAAISLLGMAFPGVFGGLWAGISKVPFLADMFGSFLFNLVDVVIMPMVFVFCVREACEAKKEIKSYTSGENKSNMAHENENNKVPTVEPVINKMKLGPKTEEKAENNILDTANKNDNINNKDKDMDKANNQIDKNVKRDEIKERKLMRTVGEIADVFLTDTLDLMPDGDSRNGEYIIQGPKLLDDWHEMLKHRFSCPLLPMQYPSGFTYREREPDPALGKVTMQSEHFGHGKLPITIPSEHIKQRLNEIYSMRQKNDGEDEIRQWERQTQERQARDELRKKKQISPQVEDCNKKDENKDM